MSQPKPQQQAQTLFKDTSDALLSNDEVDAIYVRLEGLRVALDSDPLAFGPKRLQEKTALCRKHLTEVEGIFLDVSRRLHHLKRDLRAKQSALELATKFLFAEDPEVRAGRNISDRDAYAAIKLKPEWLEVHKLEQQVSDMDAVLLVIKAKRSDLRDTQGRLRDQVRLCATELELGGRWGTRRPGAPELEPGQGVATGDDAQDVVNLIQEMGGEGEIHLGAISDDDSEDDEVETPPEESPAEEPLSEDPLLSATTGGEAKTAAEVLPGNGTSGDEIDRALAAVEVPKPKGGTGSPFTDQNLDSLLEMFE